MDIKNFCTACNTDIVEHADGSLYCSCDACELEPLGKVPEAWELNDETLARFSKDPEPTEPHSSDCGIWIHEPCDCITGRL